MTPVWYTLCTMSSMLFDDEGFTSVAEAILHAAQEGKDLLGLQVSYQGSVAGTCPPGELVQASEDVVNLCIANFAKRRVSRGNKAHT
jgi:hypothetical protein